MLWAGGGTAVGVVAATATIMVAVRMLSKAEMGAFFLAMMVMQLAAAIADLGMRDTGIKFLSSVDGSERNQLSCYLLTLRGLISLGVCAVLLLVMPFLLRLWPSPAFSTVAWYCAPGVVLLMVYLMGLAVLAGSHRFGAMSSLTALVEIIRAIISISLLYLGYGVLGLVLAVLLSRAIGIILTLHWVPFRFRFVFRHSQAVKMFKFGSWLHIGSLLSIVNTRTVEAILATYLGTAALAIYSTGLQIPSILRRGFEAVKPVMLGYISSLQMAAALAAVNSVRLLAGLLTMCAILFIALSTPLVTLLFSSAYVDSIPVMQVLTVLCVTGLTRHFLSLTLVGLGRVKVLSIAILPECLFLILVLVILTPRYGAVGGALSLLITSLLANVVSARLVAQRDVALFGRLMWAFFRSAVPLLCLLSATQCANMSLSQTMLLSMVAVGVLFLLKAVEPRDIRRLWAHSFSRRAV